MKILFSAQPGKGLKPARSKEDIENKWIMTLNPENPEILKKNQLPESRM